MGKKLTEKDFKWMSKKGYKAYRSQLDLSSFTPRGRRIFLDFWKGRDFPDKPENVLEELHRFDFLNHLTKLIEVSFKDKEGNTKDESIKMHFPSSCMIALDGAVEVDEKGNVSFDKVEFFKWTLDDGTYCFSNIGYDNPYGDIEFPNGKPKNEIIFKSFGVNAKTYDELITTMKDIITKNLKKAK